MRLIDADELKKAIAQNRGIDSDTVCDVLDIIDNAQTVAEDYDTGYQDGLEDGLNDIRPQGDWIKSDVLESVLAKCSLCGFDCGAYTYNFCPNCGATMRKGGAE